MDLSLIAVAVIVVYLLSSIKILAEYERGVIFRLGRVLAKPKGPGVIFVFAPIDRMVRISLRLEAIEVPAQMIRASARQAEAERERRAKISHAEGEAAAAVNLEKAAELMARQPIAIQLRYLQTLVEIGSEKNTTVVFPLPMDILSNLG